MFDYFISDPGRISTWTTKTGESTDLCFIIDEMISRLQALKAQHAAYSVTFRLYSNGFTFVAGGSNVDTDDAIKSLQALKAFHFPVTEPKPGTLKDLTDALNEALISRNQRLGQAVFNALPDEISIRLVQMAQDGALSADPYEITTCHGVYEWIMKWLVFNDADEIVGVKEVQS